jgi:hypothetical protein
VNRREVRAGAVVEMLEHRIRTLEDALRPFAEEARDGESRGSRHGAAVMQDMRPRLALQVRDRP